MPAGCRHLSSGAHGDYALGHVTCAMCQTGPHGCRCHASSHLAKESLQVLVLESSYESTTQQNRPQCYARLVDTKNFSLAVQSYDMLAISVEQSACWTRPAWQRCHAIADNADAADLHTDPGERQNTTGNQARALPRSNMQHVTVPCQTALKPPANGGSGRCG